MADAFQVFTQSVLNVTVTTNLTEFSSEKRFQKSLSVADLKGRLEVITGAKASGMTIQVYSSKGDLITTLDSDERLLGSYPIDDGMRLHVVDKTTRTGEFNDVSKVDKFELTDDCYTQRNDTVRAYLLRNKLGKYSNSSAEELAIQEAEKQKKEQEELTLAESIKVGDRCEVTLPNQPPKRGEVKFIGKTHFKPGWWVGVKYDEPMGKNDGSVEGQRYFECAPKYGAFVKPQQVTVGDFPEELRFDDDEM